MRWRWLRAQRQREQDLADELDAHFRLAIEERMSRGETREQALSAARREFGSEALVRETTRRMWPCARLFQVLDILVQDTRVALRSASRSPMFMVVAVSSLAIGVGACTIVFAIADSVFLRPIPGVAEPDRLVEIGDDWSYGEFIAARDRLDVLEHVALWKPDLVALSGRDGGEPLHAMYVSSGYFEAAGAPPLIGRSFTRDEDSVPGLQPVVVLGHAFWLDRFGADPGVLGATLRLNRETYTVVGVSRPEFTGHQLVTDPAVYLPAMQHPSARPAARPNAAGWGMIGRLRRDASIDGLNAALTIELPRLDGTSTAPGGSRSVRAVRASLVPGGVRGPLSVGFAFVAALVLLVLGATSANVGGMILARGSARERELGVRLALGAGRSRLVGHLLTEGLVVFVLGGAAGILLAVWVLMLDPVRWLTATATLPLTFAPYIDARMITFGVALTVGIGFVFGLFPAIQGARVALADSIRGQTGAISRRATRIRRAFVASQVAVSVLLLTAAGLFLRSLQESAGLVPDVDMDGIHITRLDLSLEGYHDAASASRFTQRILAALVAAPGIDGATVGTDIPHDNELRRTTVNDAPPASDGLSAVATYSTTVEPGYFDMLGIAFRNGRGFSAEDGPESPRVAVVNERLADVMWPGADPIGRRIEIGDGGTYQVIGVVENTRPKLIDNRYEPQVFTVLTQDYQPIIRIVVRQARVSAGFVERMRGTILSIDPSLVLRPTRSLEAYARDSSIATRIAVATGISLGLLALLLSAVGVYGIVAFTVSQRTREMGMRMALGATRWNVLTLVIAGALRFTLPGLLLGAALAIGVAQLLRAGLFGVTPLDPAAIAAVALLFLVVVTGASVAPARRAAASEPAQALRFD
jgi:predicted permease